MRPRPGRGPKLRATRERASEHKAVHECHRARHREAYQLGQEMTIADFRRHADALRAAERRLALDLARGYLEVPPSASANTCIGKSPGRVPTDGSVTLSTVFPGSSAIDVAKTWAALVRLPGPL